LAAALQKIGAGPVKTTNIPGELWRDLDLEVVPQLVVGDGQGGAAE
jgi:hypothetical protein